MEELPEPVPVVKWAGGKSRLLPELLGRIPARFDRYYEPFAGGAALFFRLAPRRGILGDLNPDVMVLYRALADGPEDVIRHLEVHKRHHSRAYYFDMRSKWNARRGAWSVARRAAAFVYLNRTCFNGLWRVNRAGDFNVPPGRYISPRICVPDALRAAHAVLERAELRVGDYRDTVRGARAGDLVYFDPPYNPATSTARFTSYTADDFTEADQGELAGVARRLAARGVHVLLSNSDTPLVRSLYRGFKVDTIKAARAINSNTSKRHGVNELVIVGTSVRSSTG